MGLEYTIRAPLYGAQMVAQPLIDSAGQNTEALNKLRQEIERQGKS